MKHEKSMSPSTSDTGPKWWKSLSQKNHIFIDDDQNETKKKRTVIYT